MTDEANRDRPGAQVTRFERAGEPEGSAGGDGRAVEVGRDRALPSHGRLGHRYETRHDPRVAGRVANVIGNRVNPPIARG